MRIIGLQASNIKRIKAVDIHPDPNVVVVSGVNSAGKSSLLDSILWAIGGEGNIPGHPIRDGEERAEVILNLGDVVVRRTWTADDKTYLRVTDAEGNEQRAPQGLLDSLIGKVSFDPGAFEDMSPGEQVTTLLKVANIDTDLDELALQRKHLFEDRVLLNREVRRLHGAIDSVTDVPEGGDEVSIGDLVDQLQAAETQHSDHREASAETERTRQRIQGMATRRDSVGQEIKALEDRKAALEVELSDLITDGTATSDALRTALSKLKEDKQNLPDLASISESIRTTEEHNARVREADQYGKTLDQLDDAQEASSALTNEIAALDQQKEHTLASANFPIEGLGFSDEGEVTFNDIPFNQLSSSERLKVSMAIAMALNPTLRVIHIRDGSLLDDDSLRLISEMATHNDYQVWIERVTDTTEGSGGIIIEDGEIAVAPEQVSAT